MAGSQQQTGEQHIREIDAPEAALRALIGLDAPGSRILAALNPAGEETRIVGGALRDALIGRVVADVDLATTLRPEAVIERLEAAGIRTIPTGIAHGTVTAHDRGRAFEITTLRADVATDGRHALVRFGRDFREDALRRDFTLNALSLTAGGRIVDYVGGLDDLEARRVRFIGDAATRIREDFLRILRFFRFSAGYADGPFDADGLAACAEERSGMEGLSRERIGQEMRKLLVAPRAIDTLEAMQATGILNEVVRGWSDPARAAAMVRCEAVAGVGADAIRRLGALALQGPADPARLGDALRLSNAERDRLGAMTSPREGKTPAAELYRAGKATMLDRLLFAAASAGADPDPAWLHAALHGTAPMSPIRAADLMARGLAPGPKLGAALARAEAAWVEAGFPDAPETIAAILKVAIE